MYCFKNAMICYGFWAVSGWWPGSPRVWSGRG
jgi:hypothetical protein